MYAWLLLSSTCLIRGEAHSYAADLLHAKLTALQDADSRSSACGEAHVAPAGSPSRTEKPVPSPKKISSFRC